LAAAQAEFVSMQNELDQIAGSTSYGQTPLLGGTYSGETFQVGPLQNTASDQIVITIAGSTSTILGVNTTAVSIGTVAAAEAAMTAVQTAIASGRGPGVRGGCDPEPDHVTRVELDDRTTEHPVGQREPRRRQRGERDDGLCVRSDPGAVRRLDSGQAQQLPSLAEKCCSSSDRR